MTNLVVPFDLDQPLDGFSVTAAGPVERTFHMPAVTGSPWERMAAMYRDVAGAVERATDLPVVISGDCPTALATLAGLQHKGIDPAVIWFDAHGDFNTDETTESGYLGGMPLAIAVGRGDQTAPRLLDLRPVDERRVLLVDARDLDRREREALDGSRVRRAQVSALHAPSPADLPGGDLYLHIDVDVLDPAELRGLRYPAPRGVNLADLARAVAALVDTGRVAGIGLACAWWPAQVDPSEVAAVVRALLPAPA